MSVSTLHDRAVLDLMPPGIRPDRPNPVRDRPEMFRQWNARAATVGDREAAAIGERASALAGGLLRCLGMDPRKEFAFGEGVDPEFADEADGTPKAAPRHSLSELSAMKDDVTFPYGGKLSPADIVFLCRTAATLHASDAAATSVSFKQVRELLKGLAELRGALLKNSLPPLDTAVGELSAAGLKSVADMARRMEDVSAVYDGPVGAVAVRWIAAAFHEEQCRRRGVPPEAVDDIWAYDPFAEGFEPGFLAAKAEHEAARESEREAVRVASELNRALWGTLRDAYAAFADDAVGDAIRTGLDALPDGVAGIAAGRRVSLIRLHWDCLAIWQEVRPGDWPGAGESRKQFEEFVGLVHEAATGTSLSDLPSEEEVGGGPARNDQSMRASADKALLSWLAQEADNGPSPVAVGDPVPPKGMETGSHRFLAYLDKLSPKSNASAGPANWRRRAGRSLSTARG